MVMVMVIGNGMKYLSVTVDLIRLNWDAIGVKGDNVLVPGISNQSNVMINVLVIAVLLDY